MDFREKSQHYLQIARAMKDAGKTETDIEKYLREESLDHNEIFLILDQLDRRPQVERPTPQQAGNMRKVFGVPLIILGGVFIVAGLVLAGMKLYVGGPFDKGYVVAIGALIAGVVFFIQGRKK